MSKEFQIRDGNLIASFDLENEDGDIDFCKLLKVSHGVADEIGMFVDCVATNKIIKDQSKQIADLEAKLAESEEDRLMWQEMYKSADKQNKEICETDIYPLQEENEQLKQQLEEKEKEKEKEMSIKSIIRTLVKYNNLNCTFRDKTNSQIQQCGDVYNSNYGYFNFEDDYDECLNNRNDSRFDIISIDLDNQDKISFCIEQLEKVKAELEFTSNNNEWITARDDRILNGICNFIDDQIKQLKEGE